MTQHTHGPWTAERVGLVTGHEKGMAFRILGNSGDPKKFEVATVYYKPTIEEAKANAHLIVAAPDLLEVAKLVRSENAYLKTRTCKLLGAAIAKAETL